MPRAKRRKINRRNVLLLGLSIIFIAILACFLKRTYFPSVPVYYMTEDWNGDPNMQFQKNTPGRDWYCPDLQMVIKQLQKQVPIEKIEVANKNNRSFGLVMRMGYGAPYLGLDSDESVTIKLKPNIGEGFRSKFENILFPQFFEKGFVTEPLAQMAYKEEVFAQDAVLTDNPERIGYFHTGIKKGGFIYIFGYGENEQHSIFIDCGKIDTQDQAVLYNVSTIAQSYSDWKANTLVQVWKGPKDNVMMLNITQIEGGSGNGEWWVHNADESWTLLASGQDDPDCYKFENKKAGKGMECYRVNKSGESIKSTVTY